MANACAVATEPAAAGDAHAPGVVPDPWLTNYEQPMTKDDAYNCAAITGHSDREKNTLFIVSREKHIDPELRNCLAKIGFTKGMKLVWEVYTSVFSADEPVRIYFNP